MAAPHAAGTAALLLSARPDLRGNIDEIEAYLNESAEKVDNVSCGVAPANNVFGNGRIDAKAAIDLALATLSPGAIGMPGGGGTTELKVVAAARTNPNWTVANVDPNITIISGGSGSGNGTVRFQVSANPNPEPRILTFRVARRIVTIFQGVAGANCTYSVSAGETRFPGSAGQGGITVSTGERCEWAASVKKAAWLSLTTVPGGFGSGSVTFSMEPNATGATRKAKVKVAGQTIVIKQRSL
jgi:hypothetical protein